MTRRSKTVWSASWRIPPDVWRKNYPVDDFWGVPEAKTGFTTATSEAKQPERFCILLTAQKYDQVCYFVKVDSCSTELTGLIIPGMIVVAYRCFFLKCLHFLRHRTNETVSLTRDKGLKCSLKTYAVQIILLQVRNLFLILWEIKRQFLIRSNASHFWRVWSWLRINAGGVPNTCKSNDSASHWREEAMNQATMLNVQRM